MATYLPLGVVCAVLFVGKLNAAPEEESTTDPVPAVLGCINLTSGATWQLTIDAFDRKVGSYPARITAKSIDWYDSSNGGHDHFDRASLVLTEIFASSTGGVTFQYACRAIR